MTHERITQEITDNPIPMSRPLSISDAMQQISNLVFILRFVELLLRDGEDGGHVSEVIAAALPGLCVPVDVTALRLPKLAELTRC